MAKNINSYKIFKIQLYVNFNITNNQSTSQVKRAQGEGWPRRQQNDYRPLVRLKRLLAGTVLHTKIDSGKKTTSELHESEDTGARFHPISRSPWGDRSVPIGTLIRTVLGKLRIPNKNRSKCRVRSSFSSKNFLLTLVLMPSLSGLSFVSIL